MESTESIAVRRPKRWDEPMDSSMSDSDVAWLRTRAPFASMDDKAFPPSTPLTGLLRNDCRLRRCEPGEIVVREGDYGNSAFLVMSGTVRVLFDALSPQQLGRSPTEHQGWGEALRRFWFRSRGAERRRPADVSVNLPDQTQKIRQVDDRQAIFLQDFDLVLTESETVSLGPGELFGEVAAMYRSPRTATVIADHEATLLEIRWQGLRILRRDKTFADTLEEHYRKHWLMVHLRENSLLQFLPEASLQRVAAVTELNSYGRLEWNSEYKKTRLLPAAAQIESEPLVSREGRTPTELVIVRSGFGRICQRHGAGHRTTAYLGKGQVFGLDEVAYNALRPHDWPPKTLENSLRAVGFLDTLSIPVETFATEVLPYVRRSELPEPAARLLVGFTEKRHERRRGSRSKDSKRTFTEPSEQTGTQFESTGLLEFIVQNRMNNGRQAMVIDLHRCTRCDDCVTACASTHDGNPRFVRQGVAHGKLQFVQACMHCTDPVCMIGCPTGSIARDSASGVVSIHESICVGCGSCAASCPYENIRMMEVFDSDGRAYLDERSKKPISKATLCDMCSGSPSGPACVAACPHDALVRIDLSESKPLAKWLEQRS